MTDFEQGLGQQPSSPLANEASLQLIEGDLREEVRRARRCFTSLDRLTSLMMAYPPGHPIVEDAADKAAQTFRDLFEVTDRLSVMVFSHTMRLLGTDHVVWETEDPRDYAWMLSRDGVYLLHFLAGITPPELRTFVDIINALVDERDMTKDAVTALFEASFKYISYDAIDESMAQLANLEMDMRNRDTKEEQELIDDLIENAFDQDKNEKLTPQQAADKQREQFEVRMQKRQERQQRMEMGSREFLLLNRQQQEHLIELRRGFTEHAELEHREGEILAAILSAHPREKLRDMSVEQIAEVMGALLETKAPWECLDFLKLIHQWRDGFDSATTAMLKDVVAQCFTTQRISQLIKLLATGDATQRRSILQMFNALHLDTANDQLVQTLAWELQDDVANDTVRYLRERSKFGLKFVMDGLTTLDVAHAQPLLDIARAHLPRSKPIFVRILQGDAEPEMKGAAISALAGHMEPVEAKQYLSPLLRVSSSKVRLIALRALNDAAPGVVASTIAPYMNDKLRERPEDEVRELTTLFLKHGGASAAEKIKSLIQIGKLAGEKDRDLALTLVKVVARDASPASIDILQTTSKDWKIHNKVRSSCQEFLQILGHG